jgi:hypothetical protein
MSTSTFREKLGLVQALSELLGMSSKRKRRFKCPDRDLSLLILHLQINAPQMSKMKSRRTAFRN